LVLVLLPVARRWQMSIAHCMLSKAISDLQIARQFSALADRALYAIVYSNQIQYVVLQLCGLCTCQ
jgi:hypothetical protein